MTLDLVWPHVGAFLSLFALDLVWARYTHELVAKRAIPAGLWAALMICLSGTAAILYTSAPILLFAAAAGAFCGTWVGVRWGKE